MEGLETIVDRVVIWQRKGNKKREIGVHTFLPHVHVVDLPVSILRLTDATVGKGVAGVIRIHPEVEVVTGVCHGQLQEGMRE